MDATADVLKDIPPFTGGNPLQHLQKYYSDYIKKGLVTQAVLRHRDERLFNSLKGFCRKTAQRMRDILPPEVNVRTHEEIAEYAKKVQITIDGETYDLTNNPPDREELQKLINTISSIKNKPRN